MRGKLIIHYSVYIILACVFIAFVNITFMGINIYKKGGLYNYHPEEMISAFKDYIVYSEDGNIEVSNDGINKLIEENSGIQILDKNNREVFSYNKPEIAHSNYSNVQLLETYNNEDVTLFLDEKELEGERYTYLLFLDPSRVKRITYSYDVKLVDEAHMFPILILLNVFLILGISFLYTLRITKPINRIVNKISKLSKGGYKIDTPQKGIYYDVEKCLSQLAGILTFNEKEREKLDEMREEWISNISHDIKTPLTSIIGNAEIMADTEYEIDDRIREKCCTTIINKSQYIKTLIEDLNLSTRLKNNTIVLNKSKINIVSLVRHVLIDIINDEKYNDSNIGFNYSDEEIMLELDEGLIKRVFINLITNAFIHNSNDVKVKIDIQKLDSGNVYISIEDNGKGVSEDELNNIFKRYYRGTNTSKKVEGSGLGMAIAHDIIKAHGAEIKAIGKLGEGLKIEILF